MTSQRTTGLPPVLPRVRSLFSAPREASGVTPSSNCSAPARR
jgi:hypothetical protein